MSNRRWVTREEIAELHDELARRAIDQGDFASGQQQATSARATRFADRQFTRPIGERVL